MARSVWKGPYVHPSLLRKPPLPVKSATTATGISGVGKAPAVPLVKATEGVGTTHARSSSILPAWVGGALRVHNGKRYQRVRLTKDRVGHKLGEFVLTRKRAVHLKKLKVQARKR